MKYSIDVKHYSHVRLKYSVTQVSTLIFDLNNRQNTKGVGEKTCAGHARSLHRGFTDVKYMSTLHATIGLENIRVNSCKAGF